MNKLKALYVNNSKRRNMPIKVKETALEPNGKLVRVLLETPEGKEHVKFAKLEHVLDENTFKSLLRSWDGMVTKKEAQEELKGEDIGGILKKRAKIEVKD